jgi:uncharacterized protein YegL
MPSALRPAVIAAVLVVVWPGLVAAAPARQGGEPGVSCHITGEKVASPTRVMLGESVQIRLTLQAECPPKSYRPADIVLVIDKSLSMTSDGKIAAAKSAATSFVDRTDLTTHRIAVLGFYSSVTEEIGLSQDAQALRAAIQKMDTRQGTDISAAVDHAQNLLTTTGRPEAHKVILLITDGSPNLPSPDPKAAARRSANTAKLAQTELFTIGLGRDADGDLLQQVATDTQHYFYSPGGSDLEAVYNTIAILVTDSVVRNLSLSDDLTPDVKLVTGTAAPAAGVAGDVLTWQADVVPGDGLTWVYQVTPQKVGSYPTNEKATATYRDVDGQQREFTFPVPSITVVSPALDKLCDQANGWTIMVHSFPDSVGVSGSSYPGCNNRFDAGDWSDGTRYRMPDLEYEVTTVDDNRVLYRGKGVRGPGMVDQRLYVRVCEPPPYRIRLISKDLAGYALCPNSPAERLVQLKDFRPRNFQRTEVRFGYVRQ